jgi:hypothetical protein
LDNLMRPNNVASVFATAAALGCAGGVWTAGTTPQPLRATLGASPSGGDGGGSGLPHVHASTTAEAVAALREAGVAVWACDTVILESTRSLKRKTFSVRLQSMVSKSSCRRFFWPLCAFVALGRGRCGP